MPKSDVPWRNDRGDQKVRDGLKIRRKGIENAYENYGICMDVILYDRIFFRIGKSFYSGCDRKNTIWIGVEGIN